MLIKTFYIIETAIECRLTSTKDFFDIKDKKCFLWAIKVGGVFFDTHGITDVLTLDGGSGGGWINDEQDVRKNTSSCL